eukprot:CAMPEP_0180160832 /NCGR_PEP_ID=MMETSP0986-20121125/28335_1 /TAXON_ID=697907 /ORGANISM="non described non described, Strain CCMP2293" /LENGTH=157 /DNA_ID=CAMNT_0022111145 /DNA_START=323 /DNA_END=792 /DNA_ORIENTATION=-
MYCCVYCWAGDCCTYGWKVVEGGGGHHEASNGLAAARVRHRGSLGGGGSLDDRGRGSGGRSGGPDAHVGKRQDQKTAGPPEDAAEDLGVELRVDSGNCLAVVRARLHAEVILGRARSRRGGARVHRARAQRLEGPGVAVDARKVARFLLDRQEHVQR